MLTELVGLGAVADLLPTLVAMEAMQAVWRYDRYEVAARQSLAVGVGSSYDEMEIAETTCPCSGVWVENLWRDHEAGGSLWKREDLEGLAIINV
jgi:hypothetical protein